MRAAIHDLRAEQISCRCTHATLKAKFVRDAAKSALDAKSALAEKLRRDIESGGADGAKLVEKMLAISREATRLGEIWILAQFALVAGEDGVVVAASDAALFAPEYLGQLSSDVLDRSAALRARPGEPRD